MAQRVKKAGVQLLVLGSLILAVAGQAASQVRYVDENGLSHWVQFENQVPNRYRDKITHREGVAAAEQKKAEKKPSGGSVSDMYDRVNRAGRAKEAAEASVRVREYCDSVRSDRATPYLLAQCARYAR